MQRTQLQDLAQQLQAGNDLSKEIAAHSARLLAEPGTTDEDRRAFLLALADKGETADEVAAVASVFRALSVDPQLDDWADRAIDVCGTGGDGAGTFNISTTVSFLLAAMDVPVFKHGNRSITSKCGSADLIEALGVSLHPSPELLRRSLDELSFCFFFAPAFHPAFKHIMPVRKSLAAEGRRTVFNLLGPLLNPGRPAHQLMGVFAAEWVRPIAAALHALDLSAAMVVHSRIGADGAQPLDELSCAGPCQLAGAGRLVGVDQELDVTTLGLARCRPGDIRGGDLEANVATLKALADGGGVPQGLLDSVLLNAGAALWVAGRADGLSAGMALAGNALAEGRLRRWLDRTADFYTQHKDT